MNDVLKGILNQNWAFYTHRQLYDMVRTEAAGVVVLSDTERAWTEFNALLADSRQRLDELLRSAGVSWEGLSADSARDGVTPLLQWADDAGTAGQATAGGLRQVIDAFVHTASAMPEPVEVTPSGFPEKYVHLFGGLTDEDTQTRLAHEAKRRAIELMDSYSKNAHSALASLGNFVPPQAVSVGLGPVQPDGAERVIATEPGAGGTAEAWPESQPPSEGDDRTTARTGQPSTPHPERTLVQQAESVHSADPVGRPDPPSSGGFQREGRLSGLPALVPVPGAGPGSGGRHDGGAQRAAGARFAARKGAAGTGSPMVPATATRRDREEDREHVSPAYLVADHEEVWAGGAVAWPAVIEETREG